MRNKVLISLAAFFILLNLALSIYLIRENMQIKSNISSMYGDISKLDIDELSKIRAKNSTDSDCSSDGSGWWGATPCD